MKNKNEVVKTLKFPKESFLNSETFADHRDIIALTVKDGEKLSIAEVQKRINDFLKRGFK